MKTYKCLGCGAPVRGEDDRKIVCPYCNVENIVDKSGHIHLTQAEISRRGKKRLIKAAVILIAIATLACSGIFAWISLNRQQPHVLGEHGILYARYPVNLFKDKALTERITTLALAEKVTGGNEIEFEDRHGRKRIIAQVILSDGTTGFVERRHLAFEMVVFTDHSYLYARPELTGDVQSYWIPKGSIAALLERREDGWIKVDLGEQFGHSLYGLWAKNCYSYDQADIARAVPEQTRLIKSGKLKVDYDPEKEMEAVNFCSDESINAYFARLGELKVFQRQDSLPPDISKYDLSEDWNWETGDDLHLMWASPDSRHFVVEQVNPLEAVGNTSPMGRMFVVNISSLQPEEKIITSYSDTSLFQDIDCVRNDLLERTRLANKQLAVRLDAYLKNRGLTQQLQEGTLPLRIGYDDRRKENSFFELSFYLHDTGHKKKYSLVKRVHGQHESGQTKIDKTYVMPDGKNFIVTYRTPGMMEFHQGTTGLVVVSAKRLSYVCNSVGLDHYRKKAYAEAQEMFAKAIFFDGKNATAIYNSACAWGLQKDAAKSVDRLNMLKALNTKAARVYLAKVKKDADFDNIRNEDLLAPFVE